MVHIGACSSIGPRVGQRLRGSGQIGSLKLKVVGVVADLGLIGWPDRVRLVTSYGDNNKQQADVSSNGRHNRNE
jgi:hypothetical protein